MSQKSIFVSKILISILLITFVFFLSITLSNTRNNIKEKEKSTYKIKINDNAVCLFENEKIIKKYRIDISVLPGEDIEILLEGIDVDSVEEADIIAEDYDG